MASSKLLRGVAAIFKPPFIGLGAVIWLYFAWSFLVHPQSPILNGEFPDPDDYMYLTHTMDWLKGQSWFDTVQHRLNPPEGVPIHFSRITELPMAALIMLLRFAGFGWIGASTITATVWPLVLFAAFLMTARWLAESFMPREWTRATAYVSLFAVSLMFKFSPGQIDHHGLIALIVALAFGCVLRMMQKPEILIWGVGAGFFLALGQAVALEILPWLLLLTSWVGLWMMLRGRVTARIGLVFGLTLYVASALFLFVTKRPDAWFDPVTISFSIIYVILAGQIAVCCAGVALASQSRFDGVRVATGLVLAAASACFFFLRFPELLAGPYGAVDERITALMFNHIMEASPLMTTEPSWAAVVLRLLFPLTGLAACVHFILRNKKSETAWFWLLNLLLLSTAIVLSVFYQMRFIVYSSLFAILPLTEMLRRGLAWAATRWRARKLFAAEISLILLVGPLTAVLLPATADSRPFNKGVLLFPVRTIPDRCDRSILKNVLTLPEYYGDRSRIVMNSIDAGPEILYLTPHSAIAAPYHGNVSGLLDSTRFFSTSDPDEAKRIARDRNVGLVVLCRTLPSLYVPPARAVAFDESGKKTDNTDATFAEQLLKGETPKWLKRFEFPLVDDYLIYEVNLDPAKDNAPPKGKIKPRN